MIEIRSWWDGKVLYTAKDADLRDADLRDANLRHADLRDADLGHADLRSADLRDADLRDADLGHANLRHANLRDADLRHANLRFADLRDADLGHADLRHANLRHADLRDAEGFSPHRVNDLLILLEQPGKIQAYKLVDGDYRSPIQTSGKLIYEIGATVEAKADPNPNRQCAAGLNIATLPWCLANWQPGHRVLTVEFTKKDVAAIPVGDGKFRVSKLRVVKEIPEARIHEWLGEGQDQ